MAQSWASVSLAAADGGLASVLTTANFHAYIFKHLMDTVGGITLSDLLWTELSTICCGRQCPQQNYSVPLKDNTIENDKRLFLHEI